MGNILKNGKIVGFEATPDDPPLGIDASEADPVQVPATESPDQIETNDEEQGSKFFDAEDRLKYPQRGHIPGSPFAGDGKIVTNPGLRQTGWRSADE